MRHLRESSNPSVDFFKEDVFVNFRKTGAETKKNKAELITPDEEENLKTLGDHSPTSLLSSTCIFYMIVWITSEWTRPLAIALSNTYTCSETYWGATIFTFH